MEYISIKNWDKYQHYHDRNPPWIKLYHSILDDYEYTSLQDQEKLLYISLFMLASRTNNKIPYDLSWIKQKAMLNGKINLDPLINAGFIYKNGNASNVISKVEQIASVTKDFGGIREETEKRREETERELVLSLIEKLNIKDQWNKFKEHRKKVKAPMTPYAEKLMLEKLSGYKDQGYDPGDCINITIEKGWKDIKLEWIKGEFK